MKNNIIRHGDLIIKPIKNIPGNCKFIGKFDKFTLALGESTGHSHLLVAEPTTSFNVYQNEQGQYILEMESEGKLTHEEHNQVTLLPDMYIVENEREFNYFSKSVQRVID